MPKPAQRVQDARPKQAIFAASIRQFPKRLVMLSEGDSWFSYPLNANIMDYIELMNDFSLLRLEHNGDEAREIMGAGSDQLKKLKYYLKNYPVEALLMSAGGNDLVGSGLAQVLNKKAPGATWQSAIKLAELTGVLDDVVAAYERLLDARDSLRPKCVLMMHSYCYFQPTGRKATGPFGLLHAGPWMRPVMKTKGIDPDTEGRELAKYLVDELHARLTALAAHRSRVVVVDMRTALPVDEVHWADEIHPSGPGFRILAEQYWRPLLAQQFPGAGVLMHGIELRPVVDRLLATRRDKVEQTQGGHRTKGLRVLFTGQSGKSKLLAAQLFAHELAVDLYEIDLERIVSKYIGDTEKNIDALFEAAKASDAVLLFDDTDHLFGPVTEESGRFPNLDVAQLRQRLESYDGIVLLGADDHSRIDPKLARQCDEVVALGD